MGIYLNPGNVNFAECINDDIYVDKSMLISYTNHFLGKNGSKYICVSRPRRFGKSMAENMIAAYYSKGCDSRELFKGLKIENDPSFEKNLNKFNVIKFDLNGFYNSLRGKSDLIEVITSEIVDEMKKEFPQVAFSQIDKSLVDAIKKVYAATGQTFIIIIDEYDVLVREEVASSLFEAYLNFLSSIFKNADVKPAISLAYLTGIFPIVRDRIQSKMNEFVEFSMLTPKTLAKFVGFTEEEVKALCKKYNMDFDECARWYDGYHLQNDLSIYAPRSVVSAMQYRAYETYWTKTGSYESIENYIKLNFEGIKDDVIKMIGGEKIGVRINTFMNTMTDFSCKDDVFTYLIHLGYLAYDKENELCYIPNYEVRKEWLTAINVSGEYKHVMKIINDSQKLLERTLECDEEYIASALDEAHIQATNPLTYNDEKSFQSAIGIAYFYATSKYKIYTGFPTWMSGYSEAQFCDNKIAYFPKTWKFLGNGYADMAFIPYVPEVPAIIVELKNNKTATGAIEQIKAKKYPAALRHYVGDMLFVGINYDEKTKVHTCKIEKIVV